MCVFQTAVRPFGKLSGCRSQDGERSLFSGALQTINTFQTNMTSKITTAGKRFVDYSRLCLHYRLDEENVEPETGKDLTFERLLQLEKLGYISKDPYLLQCPCPFVDVFIGNRPKTCPPNLGRKRFRCSEIEFARGAGLKTKRARGASPDQRQVLCPEAQDVQGI